MPDGMSPENRPDINPFASINSMGMDAAKNFPQPESKTKVPDIKMSIAKSQEEEKEYLERQLSYERFVEDAQDRINSTTMPWEARMAVRDTVHRFIVASPGLGDTYGLQRLWNFALSRSEAVTKVLAPDLAKSALGFDDEPWRNNNLISRDNQKLFQLSLMESQQLTADQAKLRIRLKEKAARERAPYFASELVRCADELELSRKLTFLWWGWKNAASGQEVGEYYMQNKLASLPTPKDFAKLIKMPSYFVRPEEKLKKDDAKKAGDIPSYPRKEQVDSLMKEMGRSVENEALGENIEKEMKIMYAVALGDNPERLMEWKLKAEKSKLNEFLIEKGVNPAYLMLRDKGVDPHDQIEDQKIQAAINSLDQTQENNIRNAWWNQLGFKDANDGKAMIGDPEMWIPLKARRGDPQIGATFQVEGGFNRQQRVDGIKGILLGLKKNWEDLSPINNHTQSETNAIRAEIETKINALRSFATVKDEKEKKYATLIPSLQLENELGYRGKVTREGCFWARVQLAGNKEKLFSEIFPELAKKDKMAVDMAEATIGIFGIPSKWGANMRDYNPDAPKFSDAEWKVDVEAWPYTSEFQNILALPWHSRYKLEAFGPEGSRNRFGPLMTDYLTANKISDYDEFGNELYIIVDKDGNLRKGRQDEGVVIADTSRTLMDEWESGTSLGKEDIWNNVQEDPFRRFLLRSFFAEGQAALGPGGGALMDMWKQKEWDIEKDLNIKLLDKYKLARRVALKPELDKEEIWKDVVVDIDNKYKVKAVECLQSLKNATNQPQREAIMVEYAKLYSRWNSDRWKEVFDYVDQTWWNGVMSTRSCMGWNSSQFSLEIQEKQTIPNKFIPDKPADQLLRFLIEAKRRGVNLFGKYTIPIDEMNPLMKKVFLEWGKINF